MTSNTSIDERNVSSSNTQKDANVKVGSSALTSKKVSETIGLAVFNEDKLVGELSGIESACYLLLTNKLDTCTISIKSPLDDTSSIDLYIYKQKNTKKEVNLINNSPYINIDVSIKARILSTNKNPEELTSDNIKKVEESVNKYLQEEISNFLYKTSLTYNSDICGLGKYAITKFYKNSDWENYNWLENYKNSIFNVTVNSEVVSSLLFTEV
ncbi:MAG: Ger(x)C family spore germination C-terminal domain-containing protein [Clostridia bacterium]|nr:Ger(x)C family spore germination C-terminal domain-containing protein [Clostridia bacterium]